MLTTLTYAYCVTIVWTYQEDQRHQKSGEGGQRTEMTRKQRDGCHDLLIFVKTLLFTYFEWLVSSWSKSAHYHGNLISKYCRSRVTHLYNRKSRIKWWCPVPRHVDNLGSVTRHPANFGAITRHAKTLCHPHLIWRNVWADLDSMVFGYPFASFQLWMCLKINTIVSFSMGQVHWIFLKFCYRATQRSNETVDGLIADLAHCRCDGKDGVICNQAQGCNRAISVTCM